MLDKLRRLRADHMAIQHGLTFYPYQEEVSDQILIALIDNLRITAGASEEEIKKLKQVEIAIEMSRRSGKTEAVGRTGEFILTFLPTLFKRKIEIGIFAAQVDQAKISYSIMRSGLRKAKAMMMITPDQEKFIAEEESARKLVLPDGSSVTTAPINKTSMIEGIGLDLVIIDEAQLADDEVVKHSIFPMSKNSNGPRVYIGKAGTRINHYYRLCQGSKSIRVYFDDVVKQRRETYEKTGDARHLIYEQSVRDDIEKFGQDSDEIQREYFGKWQIGSGQFTTMEELLALETDRKPTFHYKKGDCFVGIDVAKHPDSTVATVLRDTGEMVERLMPDGKTKEYSRKKELLNWLELRGENYQSQFDILREFISNYNVVALAIDSTGIGDYLPDLFAAHTEFQDEHSGLFRVKFSAVSKDLIYKNLKVSIQQGLTSLPSLKSKLGERFRMQMLDLQQEYKGQLLSVNHPDTAGALDDYADSWCLAEWAFARWYADNEPQLLTVNARKDDREEKLENATRDENGLIWDYWPGAFDEDTL